MFDSASVMGRLSHLIIRFCQQQQLVTPQICYTYQHQDRMPLAAFEQALAEVAAQIDDSALKAGLGMQIGASAQIDDVGVVGYLSLSCETVWEVMLRFMRYHRLAYDVNDMQINFDNDSVELTWGTDRNIPSSLVEDSLLALLLTIIRQMTGSTTIQPLSVGFLHHAPPQTQPYHQFFSCPVAFSSPCTRLQFPLALLSMTIERHDNVLMLRAEQQAEALLSALPDDDRLLAAFRQALIECLHNGESTLEDVARRMHLSKSTLETRLAEREQDFAQILNTTRRKLAQKYLHDASLPIYDVAFLLGYEQASEFEQDFQAWTGHKPRQMTPSAL